MSHLKFRLFEFGLMRYFDLDDVYYNIVQPSNGVYDTHIMQCSGLKDKNGKLIYEGDIVSNQITEYVLHWNSNYAQFSFHTIEPIPTVYSVGFVGVDDIEVIGNIYENKELLI